MRAILRYTIIPATLLAGASLLFHLSNPAQPDVVAQSKPNVLFIAVDDLNHWVKHLGRNKQVITPNIDRLAKMGVTFSNAYCAAPICNPSRAALMSGMRPSTTGVYDNNVDWRPVISTEKTLVTHFRQNGYGAFGAGKIYHGGFDRKDEWDDYHRERRGPCKLMNDTPGVGGIRFSPVDCGDEGISDYGIASSGVEQLRRKHDKPFFLTIGFHKPHMPWNVPKKYFDLYPLDKIELPPYREDDLKDIPAEGVKMARGPGSNSADRPSDHELMLQSGRWKEAVQAYLATITYVDGQIGRVLDALDKSTYKDNTIIVFWGDHGWSLGEKHHWRKFALWEEPTRAPFIWVAPGVTKAGTVSKRTVDFMSIYPTLSELCGLPIPKHIEGVSIKPLLVNPDAKWTTPALTTHGYQNHAVRTEQWRYIRYEKGGEELYDETNDPYEWTNLAGDQKRDKLKAELAKVFPKVNKPRGPQANGSEDGRGDAVTAFAQSTAQTGRWTQQRANDWYKKQSWLVGCNYNPANAINELEMWQAETFAPATIDKELGWAEGLGMNTLRVFLHDLLWSQDPAGFKKRLDQFLRICAKHKIKPMFVLFDSVWDPNSQLGKQRAPRPGVHNSGWVQSPGAAALQDAAQYPRLEAYVKGVVGAFAKDQRILAWDIWNEPDNLNGNSYGALEPKNKIELVEKLLPQAFAWARAARPQQPLTAGVWKGDWSAEEKMTALDKTMIALSDIVSFHSYEDGAKLEMRIKHLARYNRPLLCTEYMARGNNSTFESSLPVLKQYNVAAYNWGFVAGKTQTNLPWDSWQRPYVDREPAVWFHEIFHPDGRPYRAEEVEFIRRMTGKTKAAASGAKR